MIGPIDFIKGVIDDPSIIVTRYENGGYPEMRDPSWRAEVLRLFPTHALAARAQHHINGVVYFAVPDAFDDWTFHAYKRDGK